MTDVARTATASRVVGLSYSAALASGTFADDVAGCVDTFAFADVAGTCV